MSTTSPDGPHDTSRPHLMNAVTQDRYGTPEVLELRKIPVPTPGSGEVLVRIRAASLNMYDWHMTTGMPRMARLSAGVRRPKHAVPGADVAGVVEAIGAGVTRFVVGDEVMGEIGHGAFAEYAVAPQGRLVRQPAGVTFEQAAAVPMAGLTALQGLRDHGGLVAGQRVVVNGASGGVGTFAVMIARALGAQVTAVCSTAKVEMVRELGADRVIDYTVDDYTELVRDQHVLFDNVGDRGWRVTSRVLAPGGVNVMVTGPKHGWFGPMRELVVRKVSSLPSGKRFTNVVASMRTDDLDTLAELVASGEIAPLIERTWPLAGTPDALAHLGEGHARGKHVILP